MTVRRLLKSCAMPPASRRETPAARWSEAATPAGLAREVADRSSPPWLTSPTTRRAGKRVPSRRTALTVSGASPNPPRHAAPAHAATPPDLPSGRPQERADVCPGEALDRAPNARAAVRCPARCLRGRPSAPAHPAPCEIACKRSLAARSSSRPRAQAVTSWRAMTTCPSDVRTLCSKTRASTAPSATETVRFASLPSSARACTERARRRPSRAPRES